MLDILLLTGTVLFGILIIPLAERIDTFLKRNSSINEEQ